MGIGQVTGSDSDTSVTDRLAEIGRLATFLSRDVGDTSGKEVTLPWKETSPVAERAVHRRVPRQERSIAELCRRNCRAWSADRSLTTRTIIR